MHNEELHNFCPSKDGAYYLGDIIKSGSQVSSVRIVTKLPAERPWRDRKCLLICFRKFETSRYFVGNKIKLNLMFVGPCVILIFE